MKKKLVISTGAGMSAESGIPTFRDVGGLWENYPVMDVCSADGFLLCISSTTSVAASIWGVCPMRRTRRLWSWNATTMCM